MSPRLGLLGSMGTVGDAFDNGVAESFFGTLNSCSSTRSAMKRASSSRRRSSNGSNASTTPPAPPHTAGCSAPSTTRPPARHDRHNQPVQNYGQPQSNVVHPLLMANYRFLNAWAER